MNGAAEPDRALNRAQALAREGKVQDALDILIRTAETAPLRTDIYYYIGIFQHQTGNFREASRAFARILELDDRCGPAYNNLGVAYGAGQEYTKALHILQQGLEAEPENPVLLFNYGAVLDARGRLKEAIEVYQKTLRYKPDWYEAMHNLGIVLCERDQHERALELLTDILAKKPDNRRILNNIGVVLLDQGRAQEAAQYFRQALEAEPAYKTAEFNLKRALQETPAGNRDFKQAFDPEDMMLITDQPPERPDVFIEPAPAEPLPADAWDFKNLRETEVLSLLKYLRYLVEFLPDPQPKEFSQAPIRSDLEYLIDSLELTQ
ncbi:MAG: tetratricopeptide repeat protein [Spirochaetaceae bacterium]|jgi:tetratricopeptide (TPR) repeat protein|nr:tetratricopeptide repeat protein [Spirochaetaceae bacterium]